MFKEVESKKCQKQWKNHQVSQEEIQEERRKVGSGTGV